MRDPNDRRRSQSAVARRRAAALILMTVLTVFLLVVPAMAAPSIELNPSEGVAGGGFDVIGTGFEPGTLVKVRWDDGALGGAVRTGADGSLMVSRSVPSSALPGAHTVTAVDKKGNPLAQATFVVVDPTATTITAPPTTTTTTTAPPTTTTTAPPTTTTTAPPTTPTTAPTTTTTTAPTTTTTAVPTTATSTTVIAESTTTTTSTLVGVFDTTGNIVVNASAVSPAEAPAGASIEVKATIVGKVEQIQIWLNGEHLGTPAEVGDDGFLAAIRLVPELSPGIYRLELKVPGYPDRALASHDFRVTEAGPNPTTVGTMIPEQGGGLTSSFWILAFAVLVLIGLAILVLAVLWWWLQRASSDDGGGGSPVGPQPAPAMISGEPQPTPGTPPGDPRAMPGGPPAAPVSTPKPPPPGPPAERPSNGVG